MVGNVAGTGVRRPPIPIARGGIRVPGVCGAGGAPRSPAPGVPSHDLHTNFIQPPPEWASLMPHSGPARRFDGDEPSEG
jgi:hypothetical protein